jgi:hypothetical protein
MAPDSSPGWGGLWCRRVSPWLWTRSWCQRALALPRAPWHWACHQLGEGSGVATCPTALNPPPSTEGSGVATYPMAPNPPPGRGGLQSHHVSCGSRPVPYVGRLWRHHMFRALGPPLGRAPASPCVLWLQTCLLVREGSGAATCTVALSP